MEKRFSLPTPQHETEAMHIVQYLGVFILVLWAMNIWAFMNVFDARSGITRLALWAVILLIPLIGFVVWYLLGPRPARS